MIVPPKPNAAPAAPPNYIPPTLNIVPIPPPILPC
jgi:hypothetical protein